MMSSIHDLPSHPSVTISQPVTSTRNWYTPNLGVNDDWVPIHRTQKRDGSAYLLASAYKEKRDMLERLADLRSTDHVSVLPDAYTVGSTLVYEISDFLSYSVPMPPPDLFLNRSGELSFEWQPHRTGSDLVASILVSHDGSELDFFIVNRASILMDVRGVSSKVGARTFLLTLRDAIARYK